MKIKKYSKDLINEKKVIHKKPAITKELDNDIILELYLTDSYRGINTWVIGVIAVEKLFTVSRSKYDSALTNGKTIKQLLEECVEGIKKFDNDWFRKNSI